MSSPNPIVIYETGDGHTAIEVEVRAETIWLSQAQMATLFDKDSETIGLHLKNIFRSGELDDTATTEKSSVVQQEGNRQVRRNIKLYNLDAIISVGYRVHSKKGTQHAVSNQSGQPRGIAPTSAITRIALPSNGIGLD